MDREVEVKVRLTEDSKKELEEKFSFSEEVNQKDTVFTDPKTAVSYDQSKLGAVFARVRNSGGKIIFTVKKPQTGELDCIEKETVIEDPHQMKDAIEMMGYVEAVKIEKSRRLAKHEDYTLSLDEVVGLGSFLEVESLVEEDKDGGEVQKEIWEFLISIGLSKENEETKGYDTLIYLNSK